MDVYMADMVIADQVIVELKAVAGPADAHTAQLLTNFGPPRPQWRRVIR